MSSFVLKIIAAVTMLVDHAGMILFPGIAAFRIVGRIAFPIFAFCIAEGFSHTRSKLKYFLQIFLLGVLCQAVYTVATGDFYIGILLTFSLSIIIMFLYDSLRCAVSGTGSAIGMRVSKFTGHSISSREDVTLTAVLFTLAVTALIALTFVLEIDYGFFGIMLPLAAYAGKDKLQKIVLFTLCLAAVCAVSGGIQYFSLAAVLLIAAYNGKPGKHRMKYFFYIFYPEHLVLLYAIDKLLELR